MFDHVCAFSSEDAAKAALPGYNPNGGWNYSIGIFGQTVTTSPAVWDRTDPEHPVLVTPAQTLPGFWLTITLPALSEEIKNLPNNACRFVFDYDAQSFAYTAPDLNAALLQTAKIEPVFAGRTYPFGG